jgi:hypothetical protein
MNELPGDFVNKLEELARLIEDESITEAERGTYIEQFVGMVLDGWKLALDNEIRKDNSMASTIANGASMAYSNIAMGESPWAFMEHDPVMQDLMLRASESVKISTQRFVRVPGKDSDVGGAVNVEQICLLYPVLLDGKPHVHVYFANSRGSLQVPGTLEEVMEILNKGAHT